MKPTITAAFSARMEPEPLGLRSQGARTRFLRQGLLGLGVLCLVALPLTGVNDSIVLTASTIMMWIIVASSWNFISGFTGYVDFGHGVFFGIGGYTTAILVAKSGLAFGPSVPIAALACVLFALIIGYPLLRLRGVYFSIAMLGAFLAVREIVLIATPLTGGARGITLPPEVDRKLLLLSFSGRALLAVALAWLLRRSNSAVRCSPSRTMRKVPRRAASTPRS
jgi:branched-chain amino acid transport system permease protein